MAMYGSSKSGGNKAKGSNKKAHEEGVNDKDRAGDSAESDQNPTYDGNAELESAFEKAFGGDS